MALPNRAFQFTILLGCLVALVPMQACARAKAHSTEWHSTIGGQGTIHSDALLIGEDKREFSYFVPANSGSGPLPIVIYLHGHGDNMRHILGQGRVHSASANWMKVADQEGFLVIYPLGQKGPGRRGKTGWNDCRIGAKGNPSGDDVEFVRRLIAFASQTLNGDLKRVYITGMSNGGHMTMRCAMELSEILAAVAPIAALLPTESDCSPPSTPVPILMMHGVDDPLAPYTGGEMAGERGTVLSARETAHAWIRWNQLEDVPERVYAVPDQDASDGSTIRVRMRERSPGGVAVVAYAMHGAGHAEPSRNAKMGRLPRRIQGNRNRDIEMAEVVWEFFKTRTR